MQLRPYQEELISKVRQSILHGNRKICAVLGCGGGKSIIQGMLAKKAGDKGNRVLFIVHRKELCEQIRGTFASCGVDFSLCEVGMVQTISRRLNDTATPTMIIVDEAHHILSNTYLKIVEHFPQAIVLGFTATPVRLNEGGLGAVFSDLVEGVSTRWLIDNKYLSEYKYYGVTLADASKLHTKQGDYDKAEVEEMMNNSYIFGNALENWRKYADGKKTIIYCSSIATSKATAEKFREAGIEAEHIDGTTPEKLRLQLVSDFRMGKITVLCNMDLFGEGLDVPDCECVVLLRPTKSLSLHIQQSMRSMRYKEGKLALILDHVGNYTRHGLPDEPREWTLESKAHVNKTTITVRQCPECFSVCPSKIKVCPYCGAELVVQRDGESGAKVLEEIELEEIAKKPYADYTKCKTFEELEKFRKAKGMKKFNWSIHKAIELGLKIPSKYSAYMYVRSRLWGRR